MKRLKTRHHLSTLTGQAFWPAAIPLAVRSPYFSLWLPTTVGDTPLRESTQFWNGSTIRPVGLARIDNITYEWLGNSTNPPGSAVKLTSIQLTPTRTITSVLAGPMNLTITYLSPIEPSDWVKQSMPFSYVALEANSIDGNKHDVQVYFDIDGEWLSGDGSNIITWSTQHVVDVDIEQVQLASPVVFQEESDDNLIDYGSVWLAMSTTGTGASSITWQSGNRDVTSRGLFTHTGGLDNSTNSTFRAILSETPTFAFAIDLGLISSTPSSIVWNIGYTRDPAIQFATPGTQAQNCSLLFMTDSPDPDDYIPAFISDYPAAAQRAPALDQKIIHDASNISNDYADLVSLAARQVMAGVELTTTLAGTSSVNEFGSPEIYMFMKDIGNSRRVNPVEIMYQALPMFLYLNASFGNTLLSPLLATQEFSTTLDAAASDLEGSTHVHSRSLANEGLAETGNMLIMTLASARASGDGSLVSQYYSLLRQWASYLVENTLHPGPDQDSADFEGAEDNTNLALKGIIGVRAMAEMSAAVGPQSDAELFNQEATTLIGEWTRLALSFDQQHVVAKYGEESSWTLLYNLYADKLLGFNLVNSSIYDKQTSIYDTLTPSTFGLGIDSDHPTVGNSAWTIFAAATATNTTVRDKLISMVRSRASFNGTSGIFPTIYNTSQGAVLGGDASPGQGAMFALLALRYVTCTHLFSVPVTDIIAPPNDWSPVGMGSWRPKSVNTSLVAGLVGGLCGGGLLVATVILLVRRFRKRAERRLREQHISVFPSSHDDTSQNSPVTGQARVMEEPDIGQISLPPPLNPGASASVGNTSIILPSGHPAGETSQETQVLRTEMENLRRVVQRIQRVIEEPPPTYVD
ncbi:hypothetical protein CERSUDRAFT_66560 [Gelatoporia subvermispora B]|uniref:DUF1793-domain-containing protein n=1 Tax=Ceriporiopsis subvermispora (strain B) TaxID=914234 RepID=M2R9H0_CERS8|nr:hypothetical protein CERSUDRAFT_66560 [Gelatoporia subvermispora B]